MNVEQVEITYRGPSGAYSIEHDGEWFEFELGKSLAVPDALAERLLDVSDHTFELNDEIEKAEQFVNEVPDSKPTGSTQP